MLNELMKQKEMTKYKLSKITNIPYMTINDICSGKTDLSKCNAKTIYRLAHALDISMEKLLAPYMQERCSTFDNYKSATCHHVKEMGDIPFIIETYEQDTIRTYFNLRWYAESLYLLAMVDYLSRIHDFPLCTEYNDIRNCKLEQPVYPASLKALSIITNDNTILEEAKNNAIPEFIRFNIVENEVENIV